MAKIDLRWFCVLTCGVLTAVFTAGCGRPRQPAAPVAKTTEIPVDASAASAEAPPIQLDADDWPAWRGPNQDGIAEGEAPTEWSATKNVAWKTPIPGRGHSCPIVVGDRIYFETAEDQEQVQSVLCLNRADGTTVWQKEIHRGNFERAMHGENTQASSTVACDGNRLYALFLNDRKVWATALDFNGEILWQKAIGDFASKFGYSASPAIFEKLLIVSADHSQGGFIAAVHRGSGDIIWRKSRDRGDSYASPRVITLNDKPQVILGGTRQVVSYDPSTGQQNWATKGTAEAVVGTAVVAGNRIFESGGYPEAETMSLESDGDVTWRKNVKSYVPSLIAYQGHMYLANDDGVVMCFDPSSEKEKWKHRVGGNFRVSPIIVNGNIYITDMSAKTTVFKASPEKFELVAENQLGTEAFASPAVSRGQLFLRVADSSAGSRQEFLYCLGSTETQVSLKAD